MQRLLKLVSRWFTVMLDQPEKTFGEALNEGYMYSMGDKHPWLIRKAVNLAFKCVGSKENFLKTAEIDDIEKLQPVKIQFQKLEASMQAVFD